MKNNKLFQHYAAVIILLVFMAGSCTKMDHYYKELRDQSIRKYTGKVDSVRIYPGRYRLKMSWLVSPDPEVREVRIYWNNGRDSVVVPQPTSAVDTAEVLISDLTEGTHPFTIISYDDKGNPSVTVETIGRVFGDNFQSGLFDRVIREAISLREGPLISWFEETSETMIGTEIRYTDNDNKEVVVLLPMDEHSISLVNFKYGTEFMYRAMHVPDSLSIDTFYTEYVAVEPDRVSDFEVNRSSFEAYVLPTDTWQPHGSGSLSIEKMFNEVVSSNNCFHTIPGTPLPLHFTFDMKEAYQLSRFRLWQRPTVLYNKGNPKHFEVWGSNDPDADGSWDSWTLMGTFEMTKPSGQPLGQNSAEDIAFAAEGEEFVFDEGLPAMRFLRFKIIENWGNQEYISIAKLAFWSY